MGTQLLPPLKGYSSPPNFRFMSVVAKRLDGSKIKIKIKYPYLLSHAFRNYFTMPHYGSAVYAIDPYHLPVFAVINFELLHYLYQHGLISKHQHGYLLKRSTCTASVVLLQQCHCRNRHRAKLQNLSPPSVLFQSSRNCFTTHGRHRRKK